MLLENGADPNIQDKEGKTALNSAVKGEPTLVVEMLLMAGADPMIPDKDGNTVFAHATRKCVEYIYFLNRNPITQRLARLEELVSNHILYSPDSPHSRTKDLEDHFLGVASQGGGPAVGIANSTRK